MREPDRFIEHGGARLRIREYGEGDVLILIHGWALDLDMWQPQFEVLSQDHRVLAYDRRGFGLSSGTPSVSDDVADLRFLFDLLEVRRAAVLGMSQGARIALRFAQEHRSLVSCLILDGPPKMHDMDESGPTGSVPTRSRATEVPLERYRKMVRRNGIEAFRREWQQHSLMQLHSRDARTHELLREIIGRYRGNDLQTSHLDTVMPAIDWKTLDLPTLIINGECDSRARLDAAAQIASVMKHASRAIVARAGHLPNLDSPTIYNDAVNDFLRDCSGSGSTTFGRSRS